MTIAPALLAYTVSQLSEKHRTRIRALVAALRSGRYIQGHEQLAMVGPGQAQHCCLGVACVEAMNMGCGLIMTLHPSAGNLKRTQFTSTTTPGDQSSLSLPVIVREFYGFDPGNATVDLFLPPALRTKYHNQVSDDLRVYSAIQLNDEFRMTFDEIAECFEYTYLRKDWDAAHA